MMVDTDDDAECADDWGDDNLLMAADEIAVLENHTATDDTKHDESSPNIRAVCVLVGASFAVLDDGNYLSVWVEKARDTPLNLVFRMLIVSPSATHPNSNRYLAWCAKTQSLLACCANVGTAFRLDVARWKAECVWHRVFQCEITHAWCFENGSSIVATTVEVLTPHCVFVLDATGLLINELPMIARVIAFAAYTTTNRFAALFDTKQQDCITWTLQAAEVSVTTTQAASLNGLLTSHKYHVCTNDGTSSFTAFGQGHVAQVLQNTIVIATTTTTTTTKQPTTFAKLEAPTGYVFVPSQVRSSSHDNEFLVQMMGPDAMCHLAVIGKVNANWRAACVIKQLKGYWRVLSQDHRLVRTDQLGVHDLPSIKAIANEKKFVRIREGMSIGEWSSDMYQLFDKIEIDEQLRREFFENLHDYTGIWNIIDTHSKQLDADWVRQFRKLDKPMCHGGDNTQSFDNFGRWYDLSFCVHGQRTLDVFRIMLQQEDMQDTLQHVAKRLVKLQARKKELLDHVQYCTTWNIRVSVAHVRKRDGKHLDEDGVELCCRMLFENGKNLISICSVNNPQVVVYREFFRPSLRDNNMCLVSECGNIIIDMERQMKWFQKFTEATCDLLIPDIRGIVMAFAVPLTFA